MKTATSKKINASPKPVNRRPKKRFQDCMIREVRINYQPTDQPVFKIKHPGEVAEFVRAILWDNSREHGIALFLDACHQVASYSVVSVGTANTTLLHPREVFQRAISAGAVALVLAHNHPSGNTNPSDEDGKMTQRIKEAGTLLGISLLDHVIVTNSAYYSFLETNQL